MAQPLDLGPNAAAIIQAEVSPPTRMSAYFPLTPVNIADQFAVLGQQVD
jgi:hypothetical protein